MLLSKKAAEKRWCHLKDVGGGCTTSSCMAWRNGPKSESGEERGYCGLAGVPAECAVIVMEPIKE